MKKIALIVGGGKGERMKSKIPKQFLRIKNLPILMHTIKKFSHFDEIVLVLPKNQFRFWNSLCDEVNFNLHYTLVEGGKTRFESVKNGLAKISELSIIAIHDGVRPIISKNLIDNLIKKTKKGTAIIPIIPLNNSVLKVEKGNSSYIDRNNLYQVQTPQCFISSDIKDAYQQKFLKKFTDDASVLKNIGLKITTILGEQKNIKITTKTDLKIAEFFMQ